MLTLLRGAFRQRSHALANELGVEQSRSLHHNEDQWAVRLGRVLCAFAHTQFVTNLSKRQVEEFLERWLTAAPDEDVALHIRAAVVLGLLTRIGSDAYWCPKVPLAEFLVANALAAQVGAGHAGQRRFVQLFRRWAYAKAPEVPTVEAREESVLDEHLAAAVRGQDPRDLEEPEHDRY